jgi:hypothetical protein
MTIARWTASYNHTIRTAEQGSQHVHRIYRTATHDPYGADIRWILHPRCARQISGGGGAPVAEKPHDNGLELTYFSQRLTSLSLKSSVYQGKNLPVFKSY